MYEYEIIYSATGQHDFLYGRSRDDLIRRYPDIDPATYTVIYTDFID